MIQPIKHIVIFFYLIVILASCVPQKKLEYLQDPVTDKNLYELQDTKENRIKPNDELYIKVSSFDDLSYNFFGSQTEITQTAYGNELSLSLVSYTVNDSGYIYFPILGNVLFADLTLKEASEKLKTELQDYFNQPTVIIKFAYKKITVVGEVNHPGNFTYSKDQLNVFEALSLAGDLTVHGNNQKIYLLREENDTIEKILVDLTDDELLFSSNYFIQADDVLYVTPRRSLKWNVISVPISLVFSTITTAILILNYLNTN